MPCKRTWAASTSTTSNRFGRTWQVNVQAEPRFRTEAEVVRQLKVRNADGDVVPLGGSRRGARVPPVRCRSPRYNMFPAAPIAGALLART